MPFLTTVLIVQMKNQAGRATPPARREAEIQTQVSQTLKQSFPREPAFSQRNSNILGAVVSHPLPLLVSAEGSSKAEKIEGH